MEEERSALKKKMQDIDIAIAREFPKKVIPLIEEAKKSISIIVYDWLWYPDEIGANIQVFNNAIVRARNRGVDVRACVRKRLIYEILKRANIRVKRLKSSKTLHVKLMIIDDNITIVGSHNYTKNAFNINYEASVIIRDEEIARKFNEYFNPFFR